MLYSSRNTFNGETLKYNLSKELGNKDLKRECGLTSVRYFVEEPLAYAVWTTPTSISSSRPANLTRSTMKAATRAAILSPSRRWN